MKIRSSVPNPLVKVVGLIEPGKSEVGLSRTTYVSRSATWIERKIRVGQLPLHKVKKVVTFHMLSTFNKLIEYNL